MCFVFRSVSEGGKIIQRSLVLKNVTSEDFTSTFMCVVINPVGFAEKYITLSTMMSQENFVQVEQTRVLEKQMVK